MQKLHAGLDVGDYTTSICIVGDDGETVFEARTETTCDALATALKPYRRRLKNVGQEGGSNSTWLHRDLSRLGYPMRSMDAYHAHGLLKSRLNKTDRNDAHGLAMLLAKGLYKTAYNKSDDAIRLSLLLQLREATLRKSTDLVRLMEAGSRRLGPEPSTKSRSKRVPASDIHQMTNATSAEVVALIAEMQACHLTIDKRVKQHARQDPVCQRLMSVPGVGPITALTFMAAIDDPLRFSSSRDVAAYFGLTPRLYQSGVSSRSGGISHRGSPAVRKALYMAAHTLLASSHSQCALRKWGRRLASVKGNKAAYTACARKLAVLLHHLWVTGQEFDPAR